MSTIRNPKINDLFLFSSLFHEAAVALVFLSLLGRIRIPQVLDSLVALLAQEIVFISFRLIDLLEPALLVLQL